jgi:hypothetical protein
VIRQTSVNNMLDLRNTFRWGRQDKGSCPGSGDRVPTPASCSDVEGAFLGRMGLEWIDAVALLGAHSIGRGDANVSIPFPSDYQLLFMFVVVLNLILCV